MLALLSILYIALTITVSCLALPTIIDRSQQATLYYRAVRYLSLAVAFFMPYFILGFFELIFDWPRMSIASALVLQVTAVSAIYVLAKRVGKVPARPKIPRISRVNWTDPVVLLGIMSLGVFTVGSIILAMGFPRGYEAGAYHLPTAVHFFTNGTLLPWDHAYMHTFPANLSIVAGFLLQVLPERLVSLTSMPFMLLTSVVVYSIARSIGATSSSSLLVAIGMTTIPIVAFSAFEVAADVAALAFFGLAFLIYFTAPPESRYWPVAVGAAAGIAFGFKSLYLVGSLYLGLVIIWRGWTAISNHAKIGKLSTAARLSLLYVGGFSVTAAYWLARNWVELGNPLYPVHLGAIFDVLGWEMAPDIDYLTRTSTQFEWVRTQWEWFVYPWIEWHYIDENFKHSSGLGAFFAASVPVTLAVTGYNLVNRLRSNPDHRTAREGSASVVLFLGSIFLLIAWWLLQDRQPRYFMGEIVLILPLVAQVLDDVRGRYKLLLKYTFIMSAVLMFFVIFTKMVVDAGRRFAVNKEFTRADFYHYPLAIDGLPDGSVVLNLVYGRSLNYSLLGDRLSNRVLGHYVAEQVTDDNGRLVGEELVKWEVTHVYSVGLNNLSTEGCLDLRILDILDRDPPSNVNRRWPRVLYEVSFCSESN